MTTVESMARVLCANDRGDGEWIFYVDSARQILDAIREPTGKMIAAGEKEQRNSGPIYDYNTADIWRAMIDKAKSEAI